MQNVEHTGDRIAVVRCKDCWKQGLDNCPMEFYWDSHPADDTCYCAMGEQKGGKVSMNNKRLGTEFEREVCGLLKWNGFWVHFMTPDASGAQPFDIIAVRNGQAVAIDCKTSARHIFPINRLEDNQVFAFEKWAECGNGDSFVFVKFSGRIYAISYRFLKKYGKADMWNMEPWRGEI